MQPDTATAPKSRSAADGALAFFVDEKPALATFKADTLTGLASSPKHIPPKYFYDERGSQLFDRICETPEYYPTRTEMGLMTGYADEIGEAAGADCLVIEYGAGSSRKIRALLDALRNPAGYVAVDISRDYLLGQMEAFAADYPQLTVGAICADFTKGFSLPDDVATIGTRRLGFLPGSTIGNFTPAEAQALLARTAKLLGKGGRFLIGVDVKKDKAVLDAAYDDAEGVTAQFNLNLLARMQRELGAELDEAGFDHVAFYNPDAGRVEMHLEARGPQTIRLGEDAFSFADGERLHTESSYKYEPAEFVHMAEKAGFRAKALWTDEAGLFSLHMLEVAG